MSNERITTGRAAGRPSVAAERREEILDGVAACLVEVGLGATTLEAIAEKAGMTRSAIAHFVGNRDAVIAAAVTRSVDLFVEAARQQVDQVPPELRLERFVDFALQNDLHEAMVVLDQVIAHAHHDEHARSELRAGFGRLHSFVEQMAADRSPGVSGSRRATVATGLILIIREYERVRVLDATDTPTKLRRQVRELTTTLLESLDE